MSLISKLILYIKVGAKSILKMAATPSHGSWSKRVISPLPESAEASPREGALLGKPISRVSERPTSAPRGRIGICSISISCDY